MKPPSLVRQGEPEPERRKGETGPGPQATLDGMRALRELLAGRGRCFGETKDEKEERDGSDPGTTAILAAVLAGPVGLAVAAAPFPRLTVPEVVLPGKDLSLTETRWDLRGVVDRSLRHDVAEEPRLAALTAAGMAMEFWTSDSLGTWTLVHHGSDGVTCIAATGMDWTPDSVAAVRMDRALAETVHPS